MLNGECVQVNVDSNGAVCHRRGGGTRALGAANARQTRQQIGTFSLRFKPTGKS